MADWGAAGSDFKLDFAESDGGNAFGFGDGNSSSFGEGFGKEGLGSGWGGGELGGESKKEKKADVQSGADAEKEDKKEDSSLGEGLGGWGQSSGSGFGFGGDQGTADEGNLEEKKDTSFSIGKEGGKKLDFGESFTEWSSDKGGQGAGENGGFEEKNNLTGDAFSGEDTVDLSSDGKGFGDISSEGKGFGEISKGFGDGLNDLSMDNKGNDEGNGISDDTILTAASDNSLANIGNREQASADGMPPLERANESVVPKSPSVVYPPGVSRHIQRTGISDDFSHALGKSKMFAECIPSSITISASSHLYACKKSGDIVVSDLNSFYATESKEVKYFNIICTPKLNNIQHLAVSRDCNMLLAWGKKCCQVITLPVRSRRFVVSQENKENKIHVRPIILPYALSDVKEELTIFKAAWHPSSNVHVLILTDDSRLRMFKVGSDAPEAIFHDINASVRDFTFPVGPSHGWEALSVMLWSSRGDVFTLCPVLPSGIRMKKTAVHAMHDIARQELKGKDSSTWINFLESQWNSTSDPDYLIAKTTKRDILTQRALSRPVISGLSEVKGGCKVMCRVVSAVETENERKRTSGTRSSGSLTILFVTNGSLMRCFVGDGPIVPWFKSIKIDEGLKFALVESVTTPKSLGPIIKLHNERFMHMLIAVCESGAIVAKIPWLAALTNEIIYSNEEDQGRGLNGTTATQSVTNLQDGAYVKGSCVVSSMILGRYAIVVEENEGTYSVVCNRIPRDFHSLLKQIPNEPKHPSLESKEEEPYSSFANEWSPIRENLRIYLKWCANNVGLEELDQPFANLDVSLRVKPIWETFERVGNELKVLSQMMTDRMKLFPKIHTEHRKFRNKCQDNMKKLRKNQEELNKGISSIHTRARKLQTMTRRLLTRLCSRGLSREERDYFELVNEQKLEVAKLKGTQNGLIRAMRQIPTRPVDTRDQWFISRNYKLISRLKSKLEAQTKHHSSCQKELMELKGIVDKIRSVEETKRILSAVDDKKEIKL